MQPGEEFPDLTLAEAPDSSSPLVYTLEATPELWWLVSATHVGNLDRVHGSWDHLGPVLAPLGIWEVNQQTECSIGFSDK